MKFLSSCDFAVKQEFFLFELGYDCFFFAMSEQRLNTSQQQCLCCVNSTWRNLEDVYFRLFRSHQTWTRQRFEKLGEW
jgi:hypothetical protein